MSSFFSISDFMEKSFFWIFFKKDTEKNSLLKINDLKEKKIIEEY